MTHQLTIRYDDELFREIETRAEREGLSRNQVAVRLLRKGAGLEMARESKEVIGHSLDHHFGTWTEEQYQEFHEAIAPLEEIDEDLWK